jgi:hypothetical protein
MLSLDVAPPQQLLEIISTIPENGSETDSNQNEKKSSYENLKNKVSSLNRKKKKTFLATLILIILLSDLFYKIFNKEKR